MIISNNKAQFANQTTANTGTLRTYGNSEMGANDAFVSFKPATVFKRSGYLSISGTGFLSYQLTNAPFSLHMEFRRPGNVHDYFRVEILSNTLTTSLYQSLFSFQVDIPVGITGHSELNNVITNANWNGIASLYWSPGYITADPDDVWTGTFKYTTSGTEQPVGTGSIRIVSVIAEYKEQ